MPSVPPPITIGGRDSTDKLRAYVELSVQALTRQADDLTNQAIRLAPDLIELMKREGVDGPAGVFGRASSAEKTVNAWVKLCKRTSDQAISTGKLFRGLHMYWLNNIKNPIDAAKAARARQQGNRISV